MNRFVRLGAAMAVACALAACGGDDGGPAVAASSFAAAGANGATAGVADTAQADGAPRTGSLTQYVDPLIGTLASNSPNPVPAGQAGSVVPAAGLPSGMIQWAPDTNTTPAPADSKEPGSRRLLLRSERDPGLQRHAHERRGLRRQQRRISGDADHRRDEARADLQPCE